MYLKYFTKDGEFPFYIHIAEHDTPMIMHSHADFSELTAVISGTALHCVDNEVYSIKRGDIFVINGESGHGYRMTNNLKIINIMFCPENVFDSDSDICESTGFQKLFTANHNSCDTAFQSRLTPLRGNFEKFVSFLSEMIQEYETKSIGWQTLLKADLISAAVMLSRIYSLPSDDSKVNAVNIDNAVSYIEDHYTQHISIAELASMSYISERHFTRVFKHAYKVTPANYILELRMQHACMLLKNTMRNISEISMQCGFSSSNYFTRQFRGLFGVTPREYQRQTEL